MNLDSAWRVINSKTRAILLVHINGRSAHMAAATALAQANDIVLLEDAAQALGSTWNGKQLGTFGLMGAYSFSSQKIISTGNGGCVVTDDDDIAERLRMFRDFGRPCGGADDYQEFGTNLKFTDLQAVVGIEQMKKLPGRVTKKRNLGRLYQNLLRGSIGGELPPTNFDETTPWFMDILVAQRDELSIYLRSRGIGARKVYPALHSTPAYRDIGIKEGAFENSRYIAEHGLWLPSSVTLTDRQVSHICAEIREFYK